MEGVDFKSGLRFACRRCSSCCRHEPGYVFLTREDLERLAEGLSLPPRTVLARFCREVRIGGFRRVSLRERPNYDCILWGPEGCTVYEHRPFQCRSFPFWPANLDSAEHWEELRRACPGAGRGRLHPESEIRGWLAEGGRQSFLAGIPEGE